MRYYEPTATAHPYITIKISNAVVHGTSTSTYQSAQPPSNPQDLKTFAPTERFPGGIRGTAQKTNSALLTHVKAIQGIENKHSKTIPNLRAPH
ncbi:hypothetical protein PtrM4_109990 [Pyrenophora tritici-repentis]|uniref:Uncharacterized protein n=1 Tax=Pyrenophora tritici-repentis TaxID=45151 RepID=A0A834VR21_9PLEO|nr:hypothetical protein PtrM4_109990 [Pyrenophora tritici-repentis]KAI1514121.1 hypothetical protein Ptr86124_006751 [Pyrenophora tritici-repentis]KAI1666694.1 hypothetical protein L13192_08938 [Pyrenophora tritici-repentis]KAI1682527.1 hypothetical protein KJE20_07259 [Pyrenophora tritici-repentis]